MLHEAASRNNAEVMTCLKNAGIDCNVKNSVRVCMLLNHNQYGQTAADITKST